MASLSMLPHLQQPASHHALASTGVMGRPRDVEATELHWSLLAVAAALHEDTPITEFKHLSAASRLMGSSTVLGAFHIVETVVGAGVSAQKRPSPKQRAQEQHTPDACCRIAACDQERHVQLGFTKQPYVLTGDPHPSAQRFLRACEGPAAQWERVKASKDAGTIANHIQGMTNVVVQQSGAHVETLFRTDNVRKSFVREFLLGLLPDRSSQVVWDNVTLEDLKDMCPDQPSHLKTVPQHWTAGNAGRFFVGREDWALFALMFACLWHRVR